MSPKIEDVLEPLKERLGQNAVAWSVFMLMMSAARSLRQLEELHEAQRSDRRLLRDDFLSLKGAARRRLAQKESRRAGSVTTDMALKLIDAAWGEKNLRTYYLHRVDSLWSPYTDPCAFPPSSTGAPPNIELKQSMVWSSDADPWRKTIDIHGLNQRGTQYQTEVFGLTFHFYLGEVVFFGPCSDSSLGTVIKNSGTIAVCIDRCMLCELNEPFTHMVVSQSGKLFFQGHEIAGNPIIPIPGNDLAALLQTSPPREEQYEEFVNTGRVVHTPTGLVGPELGMEPRATMVSYRFVTPRFLAEVRSRLNKVGIPIGEITEYKEPCYSPPLPDTKESAS